MVEIEHWMTKEPLTCKKDETVSQASKEMSKKNIGACVVVNENSEPIGMFTERDLLKNVIAKNKDPKKTKIQDVMITPAISADINDDYLKIRMIFEEKKFRHLPITKNKKLIGIVSSRDVFK